jgi:hypothetical protein
VRWCSVSTFDETHRLIGTLLPHKVTRPCSTAENGMHGLHLSSLQLLLITECTDCCGSSLDVTRHPRLV